MYKNKLQELCQRRSWELPEYTAVKDGPDHMPRYTATVNVNGQLFDTPAPCKSTKEAHNAAARVAFEHFSVPPPPHRAAVNSQFRPAPPTAPLPAVAPPPEVQPIGAVPTPIPDSPAPSSLPIPTSGLLAAKNDLNTKPTNGEVLQQNNEDTAQNATVYRIAIGSHDNCYKDMLHMYKNQLQQYGQKQNLGLPVYTSEAEGPPHARRFRSRVSLDGKSYETLEFFSTLKEAEQAAAKVACQVLSVDVIQEDGGLYKNLLQQLAQKKGLLCPTYDTVSSGVSHRALFVSTVEVGCTTYQGAAAKTKKQAEMNAAKVAYCALTESGPATESSSGSSINGYMVADNFSQNIQPAATTKNHQDATDEGNLEDHVHAKRAKSSPENVNVNTHIPGPSHGNSPSDGTNLLHSQVENSISAESFSEQPVGENQPLLHGKTVVFPRKSRFSIPESASVMPYSDEQWVAYKMQPDQEPTA